MKYFLALAIAVCCFQLIICKKIINCYYDTWSAYRSGANKFEPADVDPKLCTHLSYSFFGITNNGELGTLDSYLDFDNDFIGKTMALKAKNPKLKVLAVVSEWDEDTTMLPAMIADPSKRVRFVSSSLKFIQEHDFDGLTLDWEYPNQKGCSCNYRQSLVVLLKELSEALRPKNLVLSIAVSAYEDTADYVYDVPNISKYVDFISLMAYDSKGTWGPGLGINAPLRGNSGTNVLWAVEYWLIKGAPRNKLLLGISFFGRFFTTNVKTLPEFLARSPVRGRVYTHQDFLGYNEICKSTKSWNIKRDDETTALYTSKGSDRMIYDDVESISLKMDFLRYMNLSGAMIWSIDVDDFRGICGEPYPLLKAINNSLNDEINEEDTKHDDNRGDDYKPEFKSSECEVDGFFIHATDCNKFYRCHKGTRYDFNCSEGLLFDKGKEICSWISTIFCKS